MIMNKNIRALGRMKAGTKNKLEAAYEKYLEERKQAGEILWYKFEGIKLRLADNCFYNPDFAVMLKSGEIEIHECKGFMREDAAVKIKVAAEEYPFRFVLVYAKPKKEGGGFKVECV